MVRLVIDMFAPESIIPGSSMVAEIPGAMVAVCSDGV